MLSLDLAVNAVVAGSLLGGFYAAVTARVTISFGMLDIVNIAHPAFIMLGSFVAYIVNSSFGVDPVLRKRPSAPEKLILWAERERHYIFRAADTEGKTDGRSCPGLARRNHRCQMFRGRKSLYVIGQIFFIDYLADHFVFRDRGQRPAQLLA
jgi:hypothetical protein